MNTERPSRSNGFAPVAAIETILVAVDCGHRSRALLQSAAALARCVGAKLVILHVYEPITYAPAHCDAQQLQSCVRLRQSQAEQRLADLREDLLDDPEVASAEFVVKPGMPEHEVCAVAREIRADLILMTTHGYRGVSHLFLGSKAEQIIRQAPCPILVLPALVEGGEEEGDVIQLRHDRFATDEPATTA